MSINAKKSVSLRKKYILLKITNTGIYYNNNSLVDWKNTNFPSKDNFRFNERNGVFWEVEMLAFKKRQCALVVRVVEYDSNKKEGQLSQQKPKYPINKIYFKDLIWENLERLLSTYKHNAFKGIAQFRTVSIKEEKNAPLKVDYNTVLITRVEVNIKYPLKKLTFKMGYIEFVKKIKGLQDPIKITLYNDHIIPEFDHVKPFFQKALGRKMIDVSGTILIKADGSNEVNCQSKVIAGINESVISSVKRLRLKAFIKPKVIPVDKSLFTPDEYFEKTEESLGNTLSQSEEELFNNIVELDGIRNKRELTFLAGKLQNRKSGLKYTLSPNFGFLFYVKGEEMDHFLWELLNSHATYIWSIDRHNPNLEMKYKLLEREINFIRDNGRNAFLGNLSESDFRFSKVKHGAQGIVDGFPNWKSLVMEKLI